MNRTAITSPSNHANPSRKETETMKTTPFAGCPQTRRALTLLLDPSAPKIDQEMFIKAMPGPTPQQKNELIDLIIQIVLALLTNKDKEDKDKKPEPSDIFDDLRKVAEEIAVETIPDDILKRDLPKLTTSIIKTAESIPSPRFSTVRKAREAMRNNNQSALGASAPNWNKWNEAVRDAMDELAWSEHLLTLVDYKNAWLAITDALMKIK